MDSIDLRSFGSVVQMMNLGIEEEQVQGRSARLVGVVCVYICPKCICIYLSFEGAHSAEPEPTEPRSNPQESQNSTEPKPQNLLSLKLDIKNYTIQKKSCISRL